jgi:hypothetical protein
MQLCLAPGELSRRSDLGRARGTIAQANWIAPTHDPREMVARNRRAAGVRRIGVLRYGSARAPYRPGSINICDCPAGSREVYIFLRVALFTL